MAGLDPIKVTSALIAVDSAEGNEADLVDIARTLLEAAGLGVEVHAFAADAGPGRASLVARWRDGGRLVLSGHLDTVPHRGQAWTLDPLGAVVRDGWIHGRGASDMKGGVAAMLVAAMEAAAAGAPGFAVVLTAAEETGCLGGADLVARDVLPPGDLWVIGESTDNVVLYGHKGATWLDLVARGVAAHGARPDLGRNAVVALARAVVEVDRIGAGLELQAHPELGPPTINIGSISGGTQPNLVPALASATVDLRTVPGFTSSDVHWIAAAALESPEWGDVRTLLDLAPVWCAPGTPLAGWVRGVVERQTGRRSGPPRGAGYFTDAAVFAATGAACLVLGPGDPAEPHTADERCRVDRIREAARIYTRLLLEAGAAPR